MYKHAIYPDAEALEGRVVAMTSEELAYLACSGKEARVSECMCETCCQTNVTLQVQCKPVECSESSVVTPILGAVCGLLVMLLLATSVAVVILAVKLKRTKHKARYENEANNYVEEQIGK